jgi:hypothetical protein
MAGRCGPSVVELPNLRRESKNLLLGFIGRVPPLTWLSSDGAVFHSGGIPQAVLAIKSFAYGVTTS